MKTRLRTIIIISVLICSCFFLDCTPKDQINYKNPDLSVDVRVEDLLSRMTLEEKFWQLFMIPGDLSDGREKYKHGIFGFQVATSGKSAHGAEQLLDYSSSNTALETATLINDIQKYFIEETRLGIPIIPFDEALHGLVREGATAFPQAIALAASWDTSLVSDVAHAICMETKSRGIRQILSPVLNIARDVRWGRTEETYGEDPFLTTQMSLSFVSQLENNGVIATPKHFIANVGDGGRDSYPIHFSERKLEEVYFPAFKACFQEAGARSVMTSYNSLDGRPCTANDWLLNKKLREEWGFNGFVISDAGATGGANVLHFTAKDYAESTQQAIENGLDVIFQTSYDHYPLFWKAFEKGMIAEESINNAVRRVLRIKFELGLFENPYVDIDETKKWNRSEEHRKLAKKAALKSLVLLKNKNQTLPLRKSIRSLAVIGTDAKESRLGGYSGPGNNPVNIVDGIRNLPGLSCKINYAPGCGRSSEKYIPVPAENLLHVDEAGEWKQGLKASYFNNINLEGKPDLTRIDPQINFRWTLFSPDPNIINEDWYSARWTGKLLAPSTGNYEIGIKGMDGYRLFINEKLIIDNWQKQTHQTITKTYSFVEGHKYDIRVEFYECVGNVWFSLIWNMGIEATWDKKIDQAVKTARESEAVVLVAGIEEGEFRDRALLGLPGHQAEMIQAVAACGKPLVIVLVGGSAITMNNWMEQADAILDVWYPGDEGGSAIAQVLFGDYNPAGRLPVTFPLHEAQCPLYYNHKPTGRGDDYLNLSGKALYPFGYGLSYTRFTYSDLTLEQSRIGKDDSTKIKFTLSNEGRFDGDEVVQLYIKDMYASFARPVRELKGFQRIHLKQGESKHVSFIISPDLLSMLDSELNPIVEPGEFRIMIGASSGDIRLKTTLLVEN